MSKAPIPSLNKLKKAELIALAEAALSRLPADERAELITTFLPAARRSPARARPAAPDPSAFLAEVERFVEDSLAGRYWGFTGKKNERGFYETPEATDRWCRQAEKLCTDALRLARDGEDQAVASGLELLLDLFDKSQDGSHDIVFAEEWGIDWEVHVDFEKLLRAFFTALARSASPEEFAQRATTIAERWTWKEDHDAEKLLRASVKGEHLAALDHVSKSSAARDTTSPARKAVRRRRR